MIEENTQAVLLLTSHFSRAPKGEPAPLTPTEYGRFAKWLHKNQFQPHDLLHQLDQILTLWSSPKGKITAERVRYLLGRGLALSIAVEKWQSAGIWIMTRSAADYPKALKSKLKDQAPAVFFGVGNQALISRGGLAIVGSRNVDAGDSAFTAAVAKTAANIGLNVVSGGARGVDETAMLAALKTEGTSLGILANGLLKAAVSGKWRTYLKNHQLCLISTTYPEAPFHIGNAMGRNKYIYCLSDYALVVRSEQGKGGTWAGASENLKREFATLFVKAESDASGNAALIEKGAIPLANPPGEGSEAEQWLKAALSSSTLRSKADQDQPAGTGQEEVAIQGKLFGEEFDL